MVLYFCLIMLLCVLQ